MFTQQLILTINLKFQTMKSIIYLIISIIISITLTSARQQASHNTRRLLLQADASNVGPVLLKQSADIISDRLKLAGFNSFDMKISEDKGQITIKLPDKTDISEITAIISAKGELAFYETFSQNEIASFFEPDNKLLKLLDHEQMPLAFDPRVGCAGNQGREKAKEYLRSAVPLKNCKLLWGIESKESVYCLFALKTSDNGRPLIGRSDVESVKIVPNNNAHDTKIHIKLKPEAISIFADATRNNLNKVIAIVIDNQVYSWPVVKSVIEGGEIEVTGNFTPDEVNYLPAIFNSQQLPLSFKILN